jgi:hypothetical protein
MYEAEHGDSPNMAFSNPFNGEKYGNDDKPWKMS